MIDFTRAWIATLQHATASTLVTFNVEPDLISLDSGVLSIREVAQSRIKQGKGKIILVGNGGALATAAHIATDYSLAGWPSIALSGVVALTSHANDYDFELSFTKQFELMRSHPDDILIALSCSGKSPNILSVAHAARAARCYVITFSGFDADNPLRRLGNLNFYVPAHEYGFVQLAHESILHAACDIENGWHP